MAASRERRRAPTWARPARLELPVMDEILKAKRQQASLRAITIRGAREHNLKNIDVEIPRDKLVVFTGLSGSGKSSLAFDTIYAEGQRRYVESLSAYARQVLEMMQKPDVDQIDGLSPAISIEQKTPSKNPRSTVGTVTEIYDYMRLLWARVGVPYSPATGLPIDSQTLSQMVDRVLALPPAGGARRRALFARRRPADRGPGRLADGRPRAGAARGLAPLSARAGRARPQGRVPQGARRMAQEGLSARQDRRRLPRARGSACSRQEIPARHRRRRRPHRGAPRHRPAPRRKF